MTWWQQLLVTLVGSGVGGAIAAWLTMRLSLHRFYRERWWQRRFDGCAIVIEALHDRKRLLDMQLYDEESDDKYADYFMDAAKDRGREAMVKLRRYADLDVLALPAEVSEIIQNFLNASDEASEQDTLLEYITAQLACTNQALSVASPAALKGLGLPSGSMK